MAATRSKQRKAQPIEFEQRLVLNQYLLSLLGKSSFEELADLLKPAQEGLDEDNTTRFYYSLIGGLSPDTPLSRDILLGYDQNIVSHTFHIQGRRPQPIYWKYFQWLSLLFTEIYCDRYFSNAEQLLADLNEAVYQFNETHRKVDHVDQYTLEDLNKLAFWNATGSGKTLLMHVNILQYQHYLKQHGRTDTLNRIILLTPNEGLSQQHLNEFALSGIPAESFSKSGRSLFTGKGVEVIEIYKLKEEAGPGTVAVEAFESNNLVLVDEGHRGASGEEWKKRRDQLSETGFAFEYSATFGQAMKASKNDDLVQEYAKCILFDYSYKYFYGDGYGKDYRIFNLAEDRDEESRRLYLTACLLAFYQQKKLYQDQAQELQPFLLEDPLWVFVGKTTVSPTQRTISDILEILLFLADFVNTPESSCARLQRLLSGSPGLLDSQQREIFGTTFTYVHQCLRQLKWTTLNLFHDILSQVFNAYAQGQLHVEHLKSTEGELALRLGNNQPFGVINVGNAAKLRKLCQEHSQLDVTETEFGESLFNLINTSQSTINILIGAKKFTEGWSSWRVSTMGLMNIGRGEGPEIIQLFGRGVRLKGYNFSLKRSQYLRDVKAPERISTLETLNIFGVRADYMQQFRDYLEKEGLPDQENRIEFILPVIKNLGTTPLKIVQVNPDFDFKTQAPKLQLDPDHPLFSDRITLDWYPKVQARKSQDLRDKEDMAVRHEDTLKDEHFAFMDMEAVYQDLQQFKAERGWHNFSITRDSLATLLKRTDWYRLYIPAEELAFTSFEKVRYWQELATTLLKKYCDKTYKTYKASCEQWHLKYQDLESDHSNFTEGFLDREALESIDHGLTQECIEKHDQYYRFLIQSSQEEMILTLESLAEDICNGRLHDKSFSSLHAFSFQQHLYNPLIHIGKQPKEQSHIVEVSPVALNAGEKKFITDLRQYYTSQEQKFFADKELYLLRNQSRGRGVGFFDKSGFYPDFILWLVVDDHQYITFVDPKSLANLEGPDDFKIRFSQDIKEVEQGIRKRTGDSAVTLNSFIVSITPFPDVQWWGSDRTELEQHHVLFQKDDPSYINKIFLALAEQGIVSSQ